MNRKEELDRAKQRIAELERIIEDLSDHGVAAERMAILRAQQVEIEQLRDEIDRLKGQR